MKIKPEYLSGFVIYMIVIGLSYYFFGVNAAGLAGVAGVVAPAIGFFVNSVVLDDEDSAEKPDGQPEPKHKQQPFVETLEERRERAQSKLSDYITIRENTSGELEIHLDTEDVRGADREAMLYVFAQWAKAEADPEASHIITKQDIRDNTPQNGQAVGVFLNKMDHFIERHYPEDLTKQREMDEDEIKFRLNENYLEEIVEYILNERRAPN
jgi:hypothetical protein